MIVLLLIIVIVILIVIIKQIVIISGMILGTIIDGDKSFGRQKTEDNGVPLPSTPPLLVSYFYHTLLIGWVVVSVSYMVCWYYMLVVATYALDMVVVGGIYFF